MSPIPRASHSGSDSGEDEEDDQTWDDWVSDDGQGGDVAVVGEGSGQRNGPRMPTQGLFPGESGDLALFDSPLEALRDARDKGCDLVSIVKRCNLDALQVIRLLNHQRRTPSTPQELSAISGSEPFLNDDAELQPVPGFESDGLLQLDFDELTLQEAQSGDDAAGASSATAASRIAELESELLATRLAFDDLRRRYASSLGVPVGEEDSSTAAPAPAPSGPIAGASRTHAPAGRDDDTHYFDSYASHDIHQVMISDSVRTLSYARFILSPSNAHLLRGKTVMDVGCGSGILSLFCARAGAKRVIAIDASDVAVRAQKNVDDNGWGHVVQVVRGKVEELGEQLKQYEGKVDLLVSEWMGYFLLYESMLPSVLHARDLYLNPTTGVLAPSHCRMTLAAISDAALLHERLHFWDDVYGFSMRAMTKGLHDEAYTEVLKPEAVVSDVCDIFDLPLQHMSPTQPSFVAPFSLTIKQPTLVHGLLSWFDTWFFPSPKGSDPSPPSGRRDLRGGERLPLPPCEVREVLPSDVPGVSLRGSSTVPAPTNSDAGAGEIVSFTTGPFGKETHWKQTVFLLKEPVEAAQGTVLSGEIHVTPSESNSRELDVEVHYTVTPPPTGAGDEGIKRRVQARLVQLFQVR